MYYNITWLHNVQFGIWMHQDVYLTLLQYMNIFEIDMQYAFMICRVFQFHCTRLFVNKLLNIERIYNTNEKWKNLRIH